MYTVMVIQQTPTNCVQANDGGPYIVSRINLYVSMKQGTHPHSAFISLRIYEEISYSQNSVLKDHEFVSNNLPKMSK